MGRLRAGAHVKATMGTALYMYHRDAFAGRFLCFFASILLQLKLYFGSMGYSNTAQRILAAYAALNSFSSAIASHEITLPGYGSFVGTTISQTLTKSPLPATVDAWLGIDYATQPVGDLRFAPVGAPAEFAGVKNATQYGLSCIQDPTTLPYDQDEACLSFNVFRPQNVSSTAKLPVLIWIHGVSQNTSA